MFKKGTAVFLVMALTMALSGTTAFATSECASEDAENSIVLYISPESSAESEVTHIESIDEFNAGNINEFSSYTIIRVGSDDLANVEAEKVVELIDNGATVYIDDTDMSLEEISDMLGLDDPGERVVDGAEVTGTFVFNQNDNYCFGLIGEVECTPVDWDNLPESGSIDSKTFEEGAYDFANMLYEEDGPVNIEEFSNAIDQFRSDFDEHTLKDLEDNTVYMQLPSKGFNGSPYYSYFQFKLGGSVFGTATITQYRYDICSYRSGSATHSIRDVVSNFTISPVGNMYVNNYKTRMNTTSPTGIIGQSYLNSNSSSSYTLSGGFSATSANLITGTVGASTTNSYTTNNQTITNTFTGQNYKDWTSVPTKKWGGASWELEPCIRVRNTNSDNYKSMVYSSFQAYGWIGVQNVIGGNIPFVQVGGSL